MTMPLSVHRTSDYAEIWTSHMLRLRILTWVNWFAYVFQIKMANPFHFVLIIMCFITMDTDKSFLSCKALVDQVLISSSNSFQLTLINVETSTLIARWLETFTMLLMQPSLLYTSTLAELILPIQDTSLYWISYVIIKSRFTHSNPLSWGLSWLGSTYLYTVVIFKIHKVCDEEV